MSVKDSASKSKNASRGRQAARSGREPQTSAKSQTAPTRKSKGSHTSTGGASTTDPADSSRVSSEARGPEDEEGSLSGLVSGVADWASEIASSFGGSTEADGKSPEATPGSSPGTENDATSGSATESSPGTETDAATGPAEEFDTGAEKGSSPTGSQEEVQSSQLELGQGELLSQGRGNSEKVSQLQEMLNAAGGQLEVDGAFGPLTEQAVRNFQKEHGLQVDGIVGPETLGALNGSASSEVAQESAGVGADGPSGSGGADAPAQASPSATTPGGTVDQAQAEAPVNAQSDAPTTSAPADPSATSTGDPTQTDTPATSTTRLEGIPERSEDALGGREFMESISHLPPGPERDQAVLNEILSGNIPDASRELEELVINRNGREIRMNAMRDYLAVGSNEDNVRIPMTPAVAQAIADRTGTSLPTDRMVDDIHAQSRQLHMPTFSDNREGIGTYLSHDQRIDEQLGSEAAPGEFVSGHKKDLVIPHRDGRVAIYGGRWSDGGRIQGYSNVHHDGYEDYSHGARLVSQQITIDGQSVRLEEALADPSLRSLFTDEDGSFDYR